MSNFKYVQLDMIRVGGLVSTGPVERSKNASFDEIVEEMVNRIKETHGVQLSCENVVNMGVVKDDSPGGILYLATVFK